MTVMVRHFVFIYEIINHTTTFYTDFIDKISKTNTDVLFFFSLGKYFY